MALPFSIFATAIFVLGLVVGSFLNVVLYRYRSGAGFGGRSKCLSCGKTLTPRMLVPLFSFMLQGGRCAYCGTRLSLQYPLVEFATGALFVLVGWKFLYGNQLVTWETAVLVLAHMTAWTLLLAMTVYDLKHKIIPDRLVFLFAVLAFLVLIFRWHFDMLLPGETKLTGFPLPVWLEFAAGPLLAAPFAALWLFSGGRAMGLGDAKLAVGIGWFLGFAGGLSALVLAFWIAFFPSLLLLFLPGKGFTMKSEIPFGPFLVLGTLVVYIWDINMLMWTV